jgi:hypothetical protein
MGETLRFFAHTFARCLAEACDEKRLFDAIETQVLWTLAPPNVEVLWLPPSTVSFNCGEDRAEVEICPRCDPAASAWTLLYCRATRTTRL